MLRVSGPGHVDWLDSDRATIDDSVRRHFDGADELQSLAVEVGWLSSRKG